MNELRRALPFLAFALAVFIAGCTLLPGPFRPSSPSPTSTPTEIEAAQAAWAVAGIDDYRLDIGFLCGCSLAGNAVVDVVDGKLVSVQLNGTEIAPDTAAPFGLTIDGLLAEGDRAVDQGGTVAATFDPATGAPVRLDIDYMPTAIDDELTIVVNSLTPAPGN